MELARRGDRIAFGELAITLGDRLPAVAHRILRDRDLAGDVTQQALVKIWQELPRLRPSPLELFAPSTSPRPSSRLAGGGRRVRLSRWRRCWGRRGRHRSDDHGAQLLGYAYLVPRSLDPFIERARDVRLVE